jgi:hypothetical protein
MIATGRFTLAALLFLCAPLRIGAQVLYGSIVGSVTDASSSAVVGAEVNLTGAATGQSRKSKTNAAGEYSFPALTAGTYHVTVSMSGFQTFSENGVSVGTDQIVRVNATLRVGSVNQSVEVSATAAELQSDSAELRDEVSKDTLENIPAPANRNFENLLITIPGFSPPENVGSGGANPSRGLTYSVNGASRNSNNVRIDGASANNTWEFNVAGYIPALEAIEQVSVVTNSFDASQGMAGGAAINVHIKSGTDQIHGSLFGYNMNGALGANPYFLPAGQQKPKVIQDHAGGTVGGPIRKNKLFYFASYDGNFIRQTANSLLTVPTAQNRTGDFSNAHALYDPATGNLDGSGRTAFPNNIIPTSRLDPIALKMQSHVPLPNLPGTSSNFYGTGSYHVDNDKTDAKVDYRPTDKLSAAARIGVLNFDTRNPAAFGDNGAPLSSSGGRVGHIYGDVINSTVNGVYILRPNFIIDSYFGLTRLNTSVEPPGLGQNLGSDYLGIPGTNGASREYSGWPWFNISSYSTIGTAGNSTGGPIYYLDQQYQFALNATWVKGRHSLRFGLESGRPSLSHFEIGSSSTSSAAGEFLFTGGDTALKGGSAPNQFNDYAGFLLGLPTEIQKGQLPFNNRTSDHSLSFTLYAQDQWHATARLSVSYGVRWNYLPLPTRDTHGLEEYIFSTNQVEICGIAGNPAQCDYHVSMKEFAPNLGLAYKLTNTLVMRAGAGINFDPAPLAYTNTMLGNYPENLSLTLDGPNTYVQATTLAKGIPAILVPDISKGFITLPPGYNANTLESHIRRDYSESWNFTLEKQFGGGLMAQAGYVATRGVDIPQQMNQNLGQLGGGAASQPFNQLYGTTATLNVIGPLTHSHYDSLQIRTSRRFSHGVQLNSGYTFSKNTGICCDDTAYNGPAIPLPQYFNLNRSLEPFDRTHNFTLSGVAELPFGKGKRWLSHNRAVAALVGGWQVNGLFAASTGKPFNVTSSTTPLNAPGVGTQRADQIKPEVQILGGVGPGQLYFDTKAFAQVTAVRFGTAGFDVLRGPSSFNLDSSLFRQFQIRERFRLVFRAEAFNTSNTPHFAAPSGNASSTGFGQITSTLGTGREGIDQRMFRLGLRASF